MMRLFLLCLSAVVFSLVSCTDKDKIPSDVLSKSKMQQVVWDMMQAERYSATFLKDTTKNTKAETFKLYAQVFAIHGITKDQFIKSYKFYMSRPDISRVMFDSLASQANQQREDMYKPKPQPADSVKATAPQPVNTKQPDTGRKIHPAPGTALPMPVPAQLTKPKTQPKRLPLRHLKRDSLMKLKLVP